MYLVLSSSTRSTLSSFVHAENWNASAIDDASRYMEVSETPVGEVLVVEDWGVRSDPSTLGCYARAVVQGGLG